MGTKLQIAIDGPASAGKSTVAKKVAHLLDYIYCDTGAMYRAVTWAALQKNVSLDDDVALKELLSGLKITFKPTATEQKVFVNGQDVTEAIRLPLISQNVSTVAAQVSVREALTKQQQNLALNGGIVMDGRDIGTTVLPAAEVKIFLVASVKERALRRYREDQAKGIRITLADLEKEIALRDKKDSNRLISPLVQAEDAVKLDTTSLTIEQVVTKIMEIIKKSK
ncbi:MAG: (d)CMP kinase [Liquorilactobacillus nagelii]|jgi:cytidylate kinase|uniref:Cytidylate kinase n=1 Tax=Liquorilactobacillus nagelii TaxID=82688 RepID=A0A3S6QVL7_9LACO|nr:(d)CMP kinase [Liquorilactobacillus nagelii]AUJ32192.1 cytidylate kinase [Liquorilactobacillus nagelii]KRL40900.1 cytidylate kinase [Liquorilactobacillus nagelii DSM 13675]MCC7615362.1 (d)CMP kinase [Liquorilactobacillus nagelii]MCI1632482.1 (d)CMP kinase [Liquorilactobacillus nagelii]MCI1700214.1 (d)CMP kinase [Liquorilactobacillus nagelii]